MNNDIKNLDAALDKVEKEIESEFNAFIDHIENKLTYCPSELKVNLITGFF